MTRFMGVSKLMGNRFMGEGDESVDDSTDDAAPTTSTPTPTPEVKKVFTQEELNRFLADERRRAQKANEKTIKQLQDLQKNASLTEEEKARLEERIETIKNDFLSKEEIQKKEQQKERNRQKTELEAREKEALRWKNLYEQNTVETGLLTAASSDPDVFNPQQIVTFLRPMTRLIEELDEMGQPTGRFIPKVRFPGVDKDKKEVILDLSPSDVLKQMKDMPDKHGNLFKSGAIPGLGGNNAANNRSTNPNEPPKDPAQFRKWRKDHPNYQSNMK